MTKITLKEIAKALGLSVSTVSKSLNDSYEISESTKIKVREFAKKQNYTPNLQAKNLKLGKTNNIGVIISTISSTFQAQIIDAMHSLATEAGYNLIMMQSQDNEEMEAKALQTLINHGVEGIIISPASENSNLELIRNIHQNICPIIIFDRIKYDLSTFKIGVNNHEAMYQATEKLIQSERTDILLLCGKNIGVTADRINGHIQALAKYNIAFDEKNIIYCSYEKTLDEMDLTLAQNIKELADRGTLPNAIIGTTDTLTTRILGVLSKLEITVPEQIAVIGFSNTTIPYSLNPPLSTIEQPIHEMAKLALDKLLLLMENTASCLAEEILLEPNITLRKSTQVL